MDEDQKPEIAGLFSGIEEGRDRKYESAFSVEDRPRGILSNTDREYLCGLRDYKHAQTEANRKQDIRERVINALHDFVLLGLLLDDEEREKIFIEEFDEDELHLSLEWLISFVYLGLEQDEKRLEDIISNGVYFGANFDKSGRWAGDATDVDASIDVEYNPDVDKIYKQFQEGEGDQLTPAEVGVLVRSGKLEPEDLDELEDAAPTFPGVYAGGGAREEDDEKKTE